MRAAVLSAPRELVLAECPPPGPGPRQVRVRLEGAGICASELPLWEGREWFRYPRDPGEPGHEGWGRIDAVGGQVANLRAGQRVAVISHRAHAEMDVAEAAHVVLLPDALGHGSPFPGEPFACAVNAMRRVAVQPGERVAVVGCGFLGLVLVQLSAASGCEVAAISRRTTALELARGSGAASAWRPGERSLERQRPFDVVFEVTGHQEPLDLAARLTRVRGRLVIAGYHQDGRRSVDMQLWNWRGLDVINAHERDPAAYVAGLREAVAAVESGRLDPGPLLTHRYRLEELAEAYRISAARPEGFIKAVWCDA
ncbi:MAG: zinc-binding dehydrogenase [Solirubrobacterales bacterium]|nr:zinc-binding dehydrogenase [Solirubrobacterales bacterium]